VTPRNSLYVDAVFHSRYVFNQVQTIAAPVVRSVFVDRNVTFEPELPLLYYMADRPSAGLHVGNATASVKYHFLGHASDIYFGAGLSLPMVSTEGTPTEGVYRVAAAERGVWNVWWYQTDGMSFFFPASIRQVTRSGIDWGVEVAGGFVIPLKLLTDQRPLGILQGGVHVGYSSPEFEAGLRIRGARIPGNDRPDPFQTSAEPYGKVFLGPAFVGAGIIFNLDPPYGPFYDPESVWGGHVEIGAVF
jgi:hypothetical protein